MDRSDDELRSAAGEQDQGKANEINSGHDHVFGCSSVMIGVSQSKPRVMSDRAAQPADWLLVHKEQSTLTGCSRRRRTWTTARMS